MKTPPATILIVDDQASNRKLLETLLRPEGYRTRTAATGEEALAAVAEHAPDLILLDAMMPGLDGYEVAGILKRDDATLHIPIIMVTAQSGRDARLAGLTAGAEVFLTKPVDRAELWLRVRNLLRLKVLGDVLKDRSASLEETVESRTSELERFRSAMDATADAILLVNRTTMRFVEANATASEMLGYSQAELLEMTPGEVNDTSDEPLAVVYDALIAGTRPNEFTEANLRRKDGSYLPVEMHRHAQHSGSDWIIVGVVRDITERREAERRLHHLAHYDQLTGLPNRTLFCEKLSRAVIRSEHAPWGVAVLFIDLDRFKNVNDSFGHAAGDELLAAVSERLVACMRPRDTLGRLSGDEFAVILTITGGQQSATIVANKIRDVLREPFLLGGHEINVSASVGIAMHPVDASDPEMLLKYADTAMYRAKQAGRDSVRFFTAQMNTDALARLDLEAALRKAIEHGEFTLHYQPKVQLRSGHIVGVEALLRWERPDHGLMHPSDFMPLLEETGMIVDVGRWVIETACRQVGVWQRSAVGSIQVSVNVAALQFIEGDLDGDIRAALHDNDIEPELLEIELTETSLMTNTERTISTLQSFKELGVQISIDDFGTGYSSLAYLHHFPIDKLKIDIEFVRDITESPDGAAIALTIIRMAHNLKLDVIAEGVETQAQLEFLRRHGCDEVQGYYFSRPLPVAEIEGLLEEDANLRQATAETSSAGDAQLLVGNHDG